MRISRAGGSPVVRELFKFLINIYNLNIFSQKKLFLRQDFEKGLF